MKQIFDSSHIGDTTSSKWIHRKALLLSTLSLGGVLVATSIFSSIGSPQENSDTLSHHSFSPLATLSLSQAHATVASGTGNNSTGTSSTGTSSTSVAMNNLIQMAQTNAPLYTQARRIELKSIFTRVRDASDIVVSQINTLLGTNTTSTTDSFVGILSGLLGNAGVSSVSGRPLSTDAATVKLATQFMNIVNSGATRLSTPTEKNTFYTDMAKSMTEIGNASDTIVGILDRAIAVGATATGATSITTTGSTAGINGSGTSSLGVPPVGCLYIVSNTSSGGVIPPPILYCDKPGQDRYIADIRTGQPIAIHGNTVGLVGSEVQGSLKELWINNNPIVWREQQLSENQAFDSCITGYLTDAQDSAYRCTWKAPNSSVAKVLFSFTPSATQRTAAIHNPADAMKIACSANGPNITTTLVNRYVRTHQTAYFCAAGAVLSTGVSDTSGFSGETMSYRCNNTTTITIPKSFTNSQITQKCNTNLVQSGASATGVELNDATTPLGFEVCPDGSKVYYYKLADRATIKNNCPISTTTNAKSSYEYQGYRMYVHTSYYVPYYETGSVVNSWNIPWTGVQYGPVIRSIVQKPGTNELVISGKYLDQSNALVISDTRGNVIKKYAIRNLDPAGNVTPAIGTTYSWPHKNWASDYLFDTVKWISDVKGTAYFHNGDTTELSVDLTFTYTGSTREAGSPRTPYEQDPVTVYSVKLDTLPAGKYIVQLKDRTHTTTYTGPALIGHADYGVPTVTFMDGSNPVEIDYQPINKVQLASGEAKTPGKCYLKYPWDTSRAKIVHCVNNITEFKAAVIATSIESLGTSTADFDRLRADAASNFDKYYTEAKDLLNRNGSPSSNAADTMEAGNNNLGGLKGFFYNYMKNECSRMPNTGNITLCNNDIESSYWGNQLRNVPREAFRNICIQHLALDIKTPSEPLLVRDAQPYSYRSTGISGNGIAIFTGGVFDPETWNNTHTDWTQHIWSNNSFDGILSNWGSSQVLEKGFGGLSSTSNSLLLSGMKPISGMSDQTSTKCYWNNEDLNVTNEEIHAVRGAVINSTSTR